jgi:pSer/pThr/pTyr-binding forkhead associated (FHA) protein
MAHRRKVFLQLDRQLIRLDRPEIEIGRSTTANVIIVDPSISRRHLSLRLAEGCVTATDLGSGNGTTLNGVPLLTATALADGDILRLGRVNLRVRVLDGGHAMNLLPTSPEPDERRESTRFSVEIPVRYTSLSSSFMSTTHNMSTRGVFLRAQECSDRRDTRCELTFFPLGRPNISVTAVVRHIRTARMQKASPTAPTVVERHPPGIGLCFTPRTREESREIEQLLSEAV